MCITLELRSSLTFLFAFSWGCTTVFGVTQHLDNTSPLIRYQGSWAPFSTPGDGDAEDTLEFSQDNLDSAILHFTGTSVTVFGALKPVGTWNMHSAYYLDGSPAVGFTPNPEVASEQHQVQFYSSGSLSDGPHTLTIVNMGQQFWFDFIALETSDSTTATVTIPTLPPGIMTLPTSTSSTLLTTSSTNPIQPTSLVRSPTSTSPSPMTSVSSTLANPFVSTYATPLTISPPLGTSTVSSNSTGTVSTHTGTSAPTSTSPRSNSTPAPPNPPADPSIPVAATSSLPSLSISTQTSTTPTSSAGTASGHALPLGEIIGIAVGGTALILALAFLSFALWRRRRRIAARATISPFVPEHEDDVNPDGTPPPPPPPDYWTSEKGSIVDRARLSLPLQVPGRQMLVITQGDHPGGVWADYQSSMPSASGYHESETSDGGGDVKAFREYVARYGRRSAAVGVAGAKRGTPF